MWPMGSSMRTFCLPGAFFGYQPEVAGVHGRVAKPLRRQWAAFSVRTPPRAKFSSAMVSSPQAQTGNAEPSQPGTVPGRGADTTRTPATVGGNGHAPAAGVTTRSSTYPTGFLSGFTAAETTLASCRHVDQQRLNLALLAAVLAAIRDHVDGRVSAARRGLDGGPCRPLGSMLARPASLWCARRAL